MFNNILVNKLTLSGYRNYKSASLELDRFNLLWGSNGSGKTNLLEALSLLSFGKGLRNAPFEELLHFGSPNLNIAVDITNNHGKNQISVFNKPDPNNKSNAKKSFLLDGEPLGKIQNLSYYVQPIWLVPKMDTIFLEDSTTQRNFFDRLIVTLEPSHLTRLNNYQKALKERNTLLKQQSRNHNWFVALEQILAEQGMAIVASRLNFIEQLNQAISPQSENYNVGLNITVNGFIENLLNTQKLSALQCEEKLKQELAQTRCHDYKTGSTSLGIHRTTFELFNQNNNLVAKSCSTGEQKLMLVLIILAMVKLLMVQKKQTPLLLLDELLVHLDQDVSNKILTELTSLPVQLIFTATSTKECSQFKDILNCVQIKNNKFEKIVDV